MTSMKISEHVGSGPGIQKLRTSISHGLTGIAPAGMDAETKIGTTTGIQANGTFTGLSTTMREPNQPGYRSTALFYFGSSSSKIY